MRDVEQEKELRKAQRSSSLFLRREGKMSKNWGEMGTKSGIADMGQMGTNLQLVDVICPCSEGREGPDVCFRPSLVIRALAACITIMHAATAARIPSIKGIARSKRVL